MDLLLLPGTGNQGANARGNRAVARRQGRGTQPRRCARRVAVLNGGVRPTRVVIIITGHKWVGWPPFFGCVANKGLAQWQFWMCGRERSYETAERSRAGRSQRRGAGGRYPHPGCFGKRGCKPLKTKDEGCKKRGKRLQEAARA